MFLGNNQKFDNAFCWLEVSLYDKKQKHFKIIKAYTQPSIFTS